MSQAHFVVEIIFHSKDVLYCISFPKRNDHAVVRDRCEPNVVGIDGEIGVCADGEFFIKTVLLSEKYFIGV